MEGQDCQRSKFVDFWHWRVKGNLQPLFPCIAHISPERSVVVAPVGAIAFKWFMHAMCLTNSDIATPHKVLP